MAVETIEEMDRRTFSTWSMLGAEGLSTSRSLKRQMHQDAATTNEAAMEWNGMEVEALRRMVKRWEDDQKVAVVVTGQDSKMAKVIRESR
jgi:hypothetical protein